jgi:hypothetical protein
VSAFATVLILLAIQASPVQGVVVVKGTNQPLSDATVALRPDQENGAVLKTITTEDDGRFVFDNVAPGRYRLTVSRRGYTRPPITVTVSRNAAAPIELPMTPAGAISGRVYNANGQPLGAIEVLAMKASYPGGRRTLTPVQSVMSNDLGEYRLFWLAPGRYYVSAVHPKAQGPFRQMLGAGMGIQATTMATGDMIRATSKADPAVSPQLSESDSDRYAPVYFGGTTDEQSATAIDIRAGTDVDGANIVVAPISLRHVRGVVTDGLTGTPAQYASLTLVTDSDGPRGKELPVDREGASFDILLLPGTHTLNATSASGEGSVTFQLPDADIGNLTLPTTPSFEIQGRMVLEGEPNNIGALLGGLQITLHTEAPRKELSSLGSYSTALPNGSFFVSAPAGDYRLNIDPLLNSVPPRVSITSLPAALQSAYVKSIRLGNTDVLNGPLHIEGRPSSLLEVVIGRNAGAIDGQVVTDRQMPVADASVVLVPAVRRRTDLYRSASTDATGRFHFDRVPPGDYKVLSWEEVEEGAWYDPEFLRAVENRGTPVRILEGRTETVRVEVIP